MKKQELTFTQWIELGNEFKEINNRWVDFKRKIFNLFSKKDLFDTKAIEADRYLNKLRSALDNKVCKDFPDRSDADVTSVFYKDLRKD